MGSMYVTFWQVVETKENDRNYPTLHFGELSTNCDQDVRTEHF
jgi:hypothetical protein